MSLFSPFAIILAFTRIKGLIIQQAAIWQKYIDQYLNILADLPIKEVNRLIIEAWKRSIKTLYYQRSRSVSKERASRPVNCKSCEP